MSRTITHVAGMDVTWNGGRYLRQRCAWCGAILIDIDLFATSGVAGRATRYPRWAAGALVTMDGAMASTVLPGADGAVPEDACFHGRAHLGPCDWDGDSYCIEEGCSGRATHRRFLGAVGQDEVVEMVCCSHAETDWEASS